MHKFYKQKVLKEDDANVQRVCASGIEGERGKNNETPKQKKQLLDGWKIQQKRNKTDVQGKKCGRTVWDTDSVCNCMDVLFFPFFLFCLAGDEGDTRSGHQVVLTMFICDGLLYSAYLIIVSDLYILNLLNDLFILCIQLFLNPVGHQWYTFIRICILYQSIVFVLSLYAQFVLVDPSVSLYLLLLPMMTTKMKMLVVWECVSFLSWALLLFSCDFGKNVLIVLHPNLYPLIFHYCFVLDLYMCIYYANMWWGFCWSASAGRWWNSGIDGSSLMMGDRLSHSHCQA